MRPSAASRESQKADPPTMGPGRRNNRCIPGVPRETEEVAHNETKRGTTSLSRGVERQRPGSASRSRIITARVSRGTTNCYPPPFPLRRRCYLPFECLPLRISSPLPPLLFSHSTFSARFPPHRAQTESERCAGNENPVDETRPRMKSI